MGVLKPKTSEGTPGLAEKPAPVQPACGRGNSLPCWAVVASARALAPSAPRPYHPLHCGQWSLLSPLTPLPSLLARSQSPSLRGSGRFRGARRKEKCSLNLFQSPSLRGSGRFACLAQAPDDADVSQSPSLRGSGRFCLGGGGVEVRPPRLNPLHCGAVVASYLGGPKDDDDDESQSPSLRGSGRFSLALAVVSRPAPLRMRKRPLPRNEGD